ncbi:MAG: hypothetical protein ACODAJ_02925 [Planctomycetota bacterium]
MAQPGKVCVCACATLLLAVTAAGEADGPVTHSDNCLQDTLPAEAAPGPLLAAAHWGPLTSFSLISLPWNGWGLPRPAVSTDTPTVRRVPSRSEGRPVEVGGDAWHHYRYRDDYREPWYREDATIEGLDAVRWDRGAGRLELSGGPGRRVVSLPYHFVSPYVMKDTTAELTGTIEGDASDRVELALSPDGEQFGHAVKAFGGERPNRFLLTTNASTRYHTRGFWVRVRGELGPTAGVRLSCFQVINRVKPPGRPQVALERVDGQRLRYRDDFRSRKVFHLAEIENPQALGWERGRVYVRGKGEPVRVELRQRFLSPEPLRAIAVRLQCATGGDRGGHQLGLSLDGQTLLAVARSPGDDGMARLRLDDPRLAQASEFYLHVRLASEAPEAVAALSSLEVEARTAEATSATVAATGPSRSAAD